MYLEMHRALGSILDTTSNITPNKKREGLEIQCLILSFLRQVVLYT